MNDFNLPSGSLHPSDRKRYFKLFILCLLLLTGSFCFAQSVTLEWTANCGSPTSFQDPGGSGNYGPNQHYIYKICPGTASRYVTVTFSNLNLGTNDFIAIINGNSSQHTFLETLNSSNNFNSGSLTFTSSAENGCLTLIFGSDGANHGSGWNATYNCQVNAGNNALICQETDCVGGCARTVCSSGTYTWQNAGENMGDLTTVNAGCLNTHNPNLERNHVWYYINPLSPGTLEVLIESGAGGQIYDFALWKSTGETIVCPAFSGDPPILCESENNGQNNTTPQGSGFSDDVWVDADNPGNLPYHAFPGYEPPVVVTQADIDAGVVFMLLINVRSNGTPQPVVNISMDGMLDCTPLNAELVSFNGYHNNGVNRLYWETQTEVESSHFIVERSLNSFDWEVLGIVNGAGTSDQPLNYTLDDPNPNYPLNYYRLKHVNYSGEITLYRTISLSGMVETNDWISAAFPNPATSELSFIHNDPDLTEPLNLEIISNVGQVVYSEVIALPDKIQGHTINLNNMAQGMYTLRIRKGERQYIERVVIGD
jgi:hypothetical protein